MSRVSFENFEKGQTKETNVFSVDLGKIILVEDPNLGGYTAFFKSKKYDHICSEGETKEEAVNNLLETFVVVLGSGNAKLYPDKILPK